MFLYDNPLHVMSLFRNLRRRDRECRSYKSVPEVSVREPSSPNIEYDHTYRYNTASHSTPSAPSPSPDAPNTSSLDRDLPPLATLVSNKSSTTSFPLQAHCSQKVCFISQGDALLSSQYLPVYHNELPNPARMRTSKDVEEGRRGNLLQLSRSLPVFVHAVCHHACDGGEIVLGFEAAGGDVSLHYWRLDVSNLCILVRCFETSYMRTLYWMGS